MLARDVRLEFETADGTQRVAYCSQTERRYFGTSKMSRNAQCVLEGLGPKLGLDI